MLLSYIAKKPLMCILYSREVSFLEGLEPGEMQHQGRLGLSKVNLANPITFSGIQTSIKFFGGEGLFIIRNINILEVEKIVY